MEEKLKQLSTADLAGFLIYFTDERDKINETLLHNSMTDKFREQLTERGNSISMNIVKIGKEMDRRVENIFKK